MSSAHRIIIARNTVTGELRLPFGKLTLAEPTGGVDDHMAIEAAKEFGSTWIVGVYDNQGLEWIGCKIGDPFEAPPPSQDQPDREAARSFADHPKSLAEVRSDKSQRGSDWAPRDALIDVLRRTDGGELNPKELIVCYTYTLEGDGPAVVRPGFRAACSSPLASQGLLAITAHDMRAWE